MKNIRQEFSQDGVGRRIVDFKPLVPVQRYLSAYQCCGASITG
jgi:hypothetical protein